jgi:XTP/dITP diphosphohydrolase
MNDCRKIQIIYVTSSNFKIEENAVFSKVCKLRDGTPVEKLFEFDIRHENVTEILSSDLESMVKAEVLQAYSFVKRPCIVEHAGIILEDFKNMSYPGGLTKPMWNTLEDNFLKETNWEGRAAVARAVIGFCDGMKIRTFVGETKGKFSKKPKGQREFYWDTIFIPEDLNGKTSGKTYAEIVEDDNLGLEYKIEFLSQSSRAMLKFLEYLKNEPQNDLFSY